jgi:hypothetical protein
MKKTNDLARRWVDAGNVGPFEAVAMDAGEGEVWLLTCTAVLTGNDVIDLKRSRTYSSGQLTILTSRVGSLPNPADELRIQCRWLSGRSQQGTARFGPHGRDEISDVDVTVEFGLVICCELALLC